MQRLDKSNYNLQILKLYKQQMHFCHLMSNRNMRCLPKVQSNDSVFDILVYVHVWQQHTKNHSTRPTKKYSICLKESHNIPHHSLEMFYAQTQTTKMGTLKMRDMKMQDWKMRHKPARGGKCENGKCGTKMQDVKMQDWKKREKKSMERRMHVGLHTHSVSKRRRPLRWIARSLSRRRQCGVGRR